MKVLVIGGGGREHALAWKIAQSPRVQAVYVAPGNAGTAAEPRVTNVPVAADDLEGLIEFARRERIDLTVVGPEMPLVLGLTDAFAGAGLRCFGPSQAAARLEGSKAFTKDFLQRHRIPTAAYATFTRTSFDPAWVRAQRAPLVVKADGLAAGKGVVICDTVEDAVRSAEAMFAGQFGAAGNTVVVEEFLPGEEASFIAIVSGTDILPLASSQDHKRRDDGDRGPNTGGMGAYSPAPVVTPEIHARIMREVVEPTVAGMAADGVPFTGFLYAGLMIDASGAPKVIEFNVRFGDPETQPVLMRLGSDFVDLVEAGIDGRLDQVQAEWDPRPALGVVMASRPYPDSPVTGDVITGLDAVPDDVKAFHAGTSLDAQGRVLSAGGRVLCVTALGNSVFDAQQRAHAGVDAISWANAFHRRDIGWRAIARESHSDA